MLKIYKHSHFPADPFGHGGNKRTAQVNGIMASAGICFHEAVLNNSIPSSNRLSMYLKGLRHSPRFNTGARVKYAIGRYIKLFENFIREEQPELFIWESTVDYNLLLAEALYKNNIPTIALPHNIESLVSSSRSAFTNKLSPGWLFEELKYLGYCDKTFTISREEQWLLSNSGINADYLPYHPSDELKRFLLDIRSKRQEKEKHTHGRRILLLGTFYNKPTFDGYVDLVSNIAHDQGIQIDIAGYGSEPLKSVFTSKNVAVHGSISNETLRELVINADFSVIHQPPSSGSLTRIPELLIAGLPLFLNTHAARSHFDTKGLIIYNSFKELLELVHATIPEIPPVIDKPDEEQALVNCIKTYLCTQNDD
jgi:hypothetical protein